jgi:excisionase family DNA binding protein
MSVHSSREAADKLGISLRTLERYIAGKKIPYPKITQIGGVRFRLWLEKDIEEVQKLLTTKNGTKQLRRVRNSTSP